jgi:hypothetical protein
MTNGNDGAFPSMTSYRLKAGESEREKTETIGGLTKREYFAAMAMQGLLSNAEAVTEISKADFGPLQQYAVRFADALIDALNQEAK